MKNTLKHVVSSQIFKGKLTFKSWLTTWAILLIAACSPKLTQVGSTQKLIAVKAKDNAAIDSLTYKTILPYKNQLDSKMNTVIGTTADDLVKKLPTGSLGSLFCDVMMDYYLRTKSENPKADFCVMNHGGIRIGSISKGNITVNTAYELMPFENELVLLELDGKHCLEIFEAIAQSGGAPVSGVKFKIVNNKPSDIFIKNQAFDVNKKYMILTSDYLANGGDKADAMKFATKQISVGIKIRDAFIDELTNKQQRGTILNAPTDERITN